MSAPIDLPAAGWTGLGNPAGSKGYKYKGAGSLADPCKIVLIKPKVIRAVCKGPGAVDAPDPFALPVGPDGVGFELVVGADRYCAESSLATGAIVKTDDAAKGVWKAIKAGAPAACFAGAAPTASLLALSALVTLVLKTWLEWRHGESLAANHRH